MRRERSSKLWALRFGASVIEAGKQFRALSIWQASYVETVGLRKKWRPLSRLGSRPFTSLGSASEQA